MLEQGPRFSLRSFRHDELKDWYLGGITNDAVKNPQTFRDDARQEGRAAEIQAGALVWTRRSAARACTTPPTSGASTRSTSSSAACSGAIPGTGFADWPITYADLEPYYTKVEWEIGVSGLAGASPFDPPRTKPYPMPPLPVKSSGVLFERGARKLGLHPVPAPMAINSQPYRGRSACVHCGFCHGFACEVRREGVDADDRHSGSGSDGPVRSAARELRLPDRHQRRRDARPAWRISIAIGASGFNARVRLSCARTAPRRRGCC